MGCAKTSDYKVDLGLPQLCRRIEYGLIPDPLSEISEDLLSTMGVIRQSLLYSGVSMIWGSLRSRRVKVSRDSLWHIGKYFYLCAILLLNIGKYFYLCAILLLNVIEHEIKSITISKDTSGFLRTYKHNTKNINMSHQRHHVAAMAPSA